MSHTYVKCLNESSEPLVLHSLSLSLSASPSSAICPTSVSRIHHSQRLETSGRQLVPLENMIGRGITVEALGASFGPNILVRRGHVLIEVTCVRPIVPSSFGTEAPDQCYPRPRHLPSSTHQLALTLCRRQYNDTLETRTASWITAGRSSLILLWQVV
jgi:hypothetical protein